MSEKKLLVPPPLKRGDTIAILSPASAIIPSRVEGAAAALREQGFDARIMPHALGSCGSYSASRADRLKDMVDALTDPTVRAVLCSRGGYGCVHLLADLDRLPLRDDPKWLIGFSDVSALHALIASHGIASVHGSMAKALAELPIDSEPNAALLSILSGGRPSLTFVPALGSRPGVAVGQLLGGNLAVIQALMRTPFDPFRPGAVLFIEDIAEPIYKVERILYQLRLSGILERLAGIVVGQFTEYRPGANYQSIDLMIADMFADLNLPVATGAPIGHIDGNMPLIHGATVALEVTPTSATISYV